MSQIPPRPFPPRGKISDVQLAFALVAVLRQQFHGARFGVLRADELADAVERIARSHVEIPLTRWQRLLRWLSN
jgi:ADP-heptose:LPS heptosyltransferase